jgi:tRNA(fMet)-specific endonuclease VapC
MSGRYLLDSNIVIALFAGEPLVAEKLETAHYAALNVVAYAELLSGSLRSARVRENVQRLEVFSSSVPLLDCDRATARVFASLNAELRKKGTPIPENDLWIASCAQQHGLTLVTRDQHFQRVPNLEIEAWSTS